MNASSSAILTDLFKIEVKEQFNILNIKKFLKTMNSRF